MTNDQLRIEVRVGLDKVDTSAYPDLYDEQINIFLDDAITEYVHESRKVFEQTQQITDDVKALVPAPLTLTASRVNSTEWLVALPDNYLYLLNVRAYVKYCGRETKAKMKYEQLDDIETLLDDPFNSPKPHELLYTMENNSLRVYTPRSFDLSKVRITFMKKPASIFANQQIDLAEQTHKSIVKRAIQIALDNLESIRSRKQ